METKELKISVPAGYTIDKENSTFECIKFKKIVKRWRDDANAKISGYYISANHGIKHLDDFLNTKCNHNIFATEKQAKSALAMAQISQIMANDKRFGGVISDDEWCNDDNSKFVIYRRNNSVYTTFASISYEFLAFHTAEERDLFLQENEDLVKDYLMID